MNSKACLLLYTRALRAHIIIPKRGSALIHVAMILYVGILNVWHHVSGKIALGVTVRGDGGVAGEGRVVGVPKLHSWGKCTMPLMNINSD